VLRALLLLLAVVVCWCYVTGRTSVAAWQVPLEYGVSGADGDAIVVLSAIKAGEEGEYQPILPLEFSRLGAPYKAVCANRADAAQDTIVTIAGRCCESGDLIQEHTPLQKVATGDLVAVLATGAYNYTMSSNYNRLPRPPIVMVREGNARVIVKGETYEDLVRNDV